MKKPITLIDGATGTELERRGYKTKLPLWSASAIREAPDLLVEIHQGYLEAGADIITANTFRTTIYTYTKNGLQASRAIDDTKLALDLVEKATKITERKITIAASISSLEDCYRPDLTPAKSILKEFHGQQINAIASAGYELVMIETMHNITEAKVIAKYCFQKQIDFMISFVTQSDGRLLSGELLMDAIEMVKKYQPKAILLNCRPAHELLANYDVLQNYDGKIGVYPNGTGQPDEEFGWTFDDPNSSVIFLDQVKPFFTKRLDVIGGCCGTTPDDIELLRKYIDSE